MNKLIQFAQITQNDFNNVPKAALDDSAIETALQLVFGAAGAIALLIMVIAGLRYSLSRGDAQTVAKAKDTIIYALVGLVISISAFAIVRFATESL